ncbi:MAG: hypothetical protein JWQ95_7012 [Sphaerisporangium sp.]|nr:hypothetical protein [Sphaerisporangium sp.]
MAQPRMARTEVSDRHGGDFCWPLGRASGACPERWGISYRASTLIPATATAEARSV